MSPFANFIYMTIMATICVTFLFLTVKFILGSLYDLIEAVKELIKRKHHRS